ncbi:MAG: type II secretion system protein [Armatimonadota bacterium]|nr:type II secretion system protein [Armatimonadota bacterium]
MSYTLHRFGLTLIELVLVTAIIALLAGIIWSVLAPARERSRQAVCISNLTQLGHAYRMYRDDWDGIEPSKGLALEYWEIGLPPERPPLKSLEPYLKSKEIWHCPSCFLLPDPHRCKAPNHYWAHYITHRDFENPDPYEPRVPYDMWFPFGILNSSPISFKRMIALVPDWPILLCDTHHYFYHPPGEIWYDRLYFGVIASDYSVRRFRRSEYLLRLYQELNL